MRKLFAATTILLTVPATLPANAESRAYRAEYTVTALGFPVGVTRIETTITPDSYTLSGSLKTSGLAALFAPTEGSLNATGRIGGAEVEAKDFRLDYVTGKRRQRTEVGFSGGAVTHTVNAPKVRKSRDWIEVTEMHLQHTLDPISAMLVPASSPAGVCDRTIRVFDGAMRADVKLTYLRTVPFATEGYKGDAVTCRAQFLPVSGYPKNKKDVAWMRDKARIDVSFAPVEGTALFAPVTATIATQIGPVRIYATRFESVAQ